MHLLPRLAIFLMCSIFCSAQAEQNADAQTPAGGAEEIEKMCFGYAKKGWQIAYTAQEMKMNESQARNLAGQYFAPAQVAQQQELISRLYRGEYKKPQEFATFLQNKCFSDLPPHPGRVAYPDAKTQSCFSQLVFPQYAYAQRYGKKVSLEQALESVAGLPSPKAEMMRVILRDMYASRSPQDDANVYWSVFYSCIKN